MTAVPEWQKCPVCDGLAWEGEVNDGDRRPCMSCGAPIYVHVLDTEPGEEPFIETLAFDDDDAIAWARRTLRERDEARKERDVLRDRVESYKEDFASLNACLDRVGQERDEARAERDEVRKERDEARTMVEAARRILLSSVADHMTEHAYQELASALESHPRAACEVSS